MNIIRKYKLSLLKYDSLTKKEVEDLNIIFKEVKYSKENFELINFIYNNLLNLKQVKLVKYPEYLFYFKDDNCIFKKDLYSSWLGVNSDLIWKVFETKFGYNYQEIQKLIKGIVEPVYKLNKITPSSMKDRVIFDLLDKI